MTAATVIPPLPDAAPTGARRLLGLTGQVAVVNLLIAGLMSMISGQHFLNSLVYSQCIGLSIWGCIEGGRRLMQVGATGWPAGGRVAALVAAGCALGYAVGITLADTLFGYSSWRDYLRDPRHLLGDLGPTVAFCTLVAGGFFLRGQARADRARTAAATHEATLARLDMLQSQLEPHMLFNTLANLRALIAADPDRATRMLDHLIAFLRATLAASRQPEHPLADEFARIDDYLALMQVRMGDRLRARTTLPPELATLARAAAAAAAAGGERDQARPGAAARRRRAARVGRARRRGAGAARGRLRPRAGGRRGGARARPRPARLRLRPGAGARAPAHAARRRRPLHAPIPSRGRHAGRDPAAASPTSPANDMTTALIAEDEPLLAQALRAELARAWPELQLGDAAVDGDEAVERALAERPDVVFLDIRMPGRTGLEAAEAIVEEWPGAPPRCR